MIFRIVIVLFCALGFSAPAYADSQLPRCLDADKKDTYGFGHSAETTIECQLITHDGSGISFVPHYANKSSVQSAITVNIYKKSIQYQQINDVTARLDSQVIGPFLDDVDGDGRDELITITDIGANNEEYKIWRRSAGNDHFSLAVEFFGDDYGHISAHNYFIAHTHLSAQEIIFSVFLVSQPYRLLGKVNYNFTTHRCGIAEDGVPNLCNNQILRNYINHLH